MTRTIDMTPTWEGLLPYFFACLDGGTPEAKKIAREELRRMAQAADLWNASIPKTERNEIDEG